MEYDDAGYYLSHIYDVLTIVYIQSEVNKSKFATMNGSLAQMRFDFSIVWRLK